jgi:Histidine kinase-, DNA gyrase B-, and HSP90-like ATPase
MEQKRQSLKLESAADLPPVRADRDRVAQNMTNLLSNAHKYTLDGGAVSVRAQAGQDEVQVEVSDTGVGMTADERDKLFTKSKRWDGVEALVEKHAREYAVNLFDGVYGPGKGHAPMVYAGDPRQDVPSALRKHLTETLRNRDATVVKGWLEGIAEGGAEDLGLE